MAAALRIATMSRAEVDLAIRQASDEGWNPGVDDAAAFHAADPDGFLIGKRMYTDVAPDIALGRIFGVTTFELG